MRPPPSTPTDSTAARPPPGRRRPLSFLSAVWAKKISHELARHASTPPARRRRAPRAPAPLEALLGARASPPRAPSPAPGSARASSPRSACCAFRKSDGRGRAGSPRARLSSARRDPSSRRLLTSAARSTAQRARRRARGPRRATRRAAGARHRPRPRARWSSALCGRTVLPVQDEVERGLASPTSRGSRWVPPAPGMTPSWTSGRPSRVSWSSLATRQWQASAHSSPPPRQAPWMAATTGFGKRLQPVEIAAWPLAAGPRPSAAVCAACEHLDRGAGDEAFLLAAREHHRLDRRSPSSRSEDARELLGHLGSSVFTGSRPERPGGRRPRRPPPRRGSSSTSPKPRLSSPLLRSCTPPFVEEPPSHSRSSTTAAPRPPAAQTVSSACCFLLRRELAQGLEDHPRARGRERVAEGDGAAVDVELGRVDLADRLPRAESSCSANFGARQRPAGWRAPGPRTPRACRRGPCPPA